MRIIVPLHDKVIATMVDSFGEQRSSGGVIYLENEGSAESIRPRWFKVVAVGPDQKDVAVDQYVLVEHGRWSRGINIEGTGRNEDRIFHIDMDSALLVSDEVL
jgi:co-chaperonin GroES (HSP10)